MKRSQAIALCAALPIVLATACSDFLTGEKLTTDPNNPTAATADQLFTGVQVASYGLLEGTGALLTYTWTQQTSGVARQWINLAQYSHDEFTVDYEFGNVYGTGGLVDIREVQRQAGNAGNRKLVGMAKVLEALFIGTAADWWGDVPYSEALASATPVLDPQAQVYASLQTLLDGAIADLNGGGTGPLSVDFYYNNNSAKWIEAAHTLKARYALHTLPRDYAKAESEAALGLKKDNDFQSSHTTSVGERNLFYEFSITRAGDVEPGELLVDMLNARGDTPLLQNYFLPNSAGDYVGSPADKSVGATLVSPFNLPADRSTKFITHAENQMILAEAQYRNGKQPTALITLNAFRAERSAGPLNLTGPALLARILEEKYVTNYMNPEVWADYRRTCYPNVAPPDDAKRNFIPGRFYYGSTELHTNPNVPDLDAQEAQPSGATFPKVVADPLGNPCVGRMNRPGT